jgi:hypothetical protein
MPKSPTDRGTGYNQLMSRKWSTLGSTIREGSFLLVLVFAGWLSCKHSLSTSPAKDAGGGSTQDAVGGDVPGTGGAIADGSLPGTGGINPCPYLPEPIDGADWLCGTVAVSTTRRPFDMLIVLDRSGSMRRSLTADCLCTAGTGDDATNLCGNTADCTDRWTTMKSALGQIVRDTPGVEWGIEVLPFPADSTCSVSPTPQVPIGADSGAMVQAQLDAITPGGNTPLAAAISAATVYLSALADENGKAILLATDGVPECAEGQSSPIPGDLEDAIAASAAALRAGFPVYVIGAGPAAPALDDLARAGGTGTHYPGTSPDQISDALPAVSRLTMSCTISFPSPPPDVNNVAVYVDKQLVPKDPANGWNYGATTSVIELTGSYCENLITARDTSIQVLFGCPGMHPPMCIP